ncbi:MAG: hypothetical protein WDN45_15605 [Caulobacteraceae bacterium]
MKPIVIALAAVVAGSLPAAVSAQPRPADWSALAKLPDWSGAWVPDLKDQVAQVHGNPAPWTPEAGKKIAFLEAEDLAGRPRGLFLDCLPESMPSWMLISHNPLEFLFTPGRVTILGESDSNRLRRIWTDGRGHPSDPDPTFHGDSIGHWEGDALVVDTVGILPQTLIAIGESVGVPNNGDVHVVERIHLTGPDVLADDLTITAPHVFTAPWKTTRLYKRVRGPGADFVEGVCRQGDFTEAKDEDGDAVFVPLRQKDGNILPPAAR